MPNDSLFVEVLLDQNFAKPLDYAVPIDLRPQVQVGMRVEVPLKTQIKKGTIAAIKQTSAWPDPRPIARLLAVRSELSDAQWKLAEWMSQYYIAPLQRTIKCFIPANIRQEIAPKKLIWVSLIKTRDETVAICEQLQRTNPLHADLLAKLLKTPRGAFFSDLKKDLPIERSDLKKLSQLKLIEVQTISSSEDLMLEEDFFPTQPKKLTDEQKICLDSITDSLEQKKFEVHLIQGITGSGKTEIYLQAIKKALDQGRSALLLVPEISLTSQTIERIRSRFEEKVAILHHRRSQGERTQAWEDLREGKIRLAVGARSALFCPAQNLGLIIIDEEHDSSYKQSEEAPCYQARDVAIMRGRFENAVVLLGSATPSVESRYNAETGKYRLHILKTRANASSLPSVKIIDMQRAYEITGGFTHFSPELLDAMKQRVERGEQTLLFLNRRGYHRMQICPSCKSIVKCPHCDISLTFHREENHLRCHLCDYQAPTARNCAACGSNNTLEFKGFGTEHVERSLHAVFPDIRTLRMDHDTTRRKQSHEELFKQFRAHKADVLIGTQMIAKGFHFPSVTLVGVLNPDSMLAIPDFRSPEHVFQLLTQVAGRAGRSHLAGEVIFQTFLPDHPVLRLAAAQDYEAFYRSAIEERHQFNYPPFCRLAKLLFTSTDAAKAEESAREAHAKIQAILPSGVELLPVVPAGHPKIKDVYRFQFLIKAPKAALIQKILSQLKDKIKVDIDPNSSFF